MKPRYSKKRLSRKNNKRKSRKLSKKLTGGGPLNSFKKRWYRTSRRRDALRKFEDQRNKNIGRFREDAGRRELNQKIQQLGVLMSQGERPTLEQLSFLQKSTTPEELNSKVNHQYLEEQVKKLKKIVYPPSGETPENLGRKRTDFDDFFDASVNPQQGEDPMIYVGDAKKGFITPIQKRYLENYVKFVKLGYTNYRLFGAILDKLETFKADNQSNTSEKCNKKKMEVLTKKIKFFESILYNNVFNQKIQKTVGEAFTRALREADPTNPDNPRPDRILGTVGLNEALEQSDCRGGRQTSYLGVKRLYRYAKRGLKRHRASNKNIANRREALRTNSGSSAVKYEPTLTGPGNAALYE